VEKRKGLRARRGEWSDILWNEVEEVVGWRKME